MPRARWMLSFVMFAVSCAAAAPSLSAEPTPCEAWRPKFLCLCFEYRCKPLPPVDCGYCATDACYRPKPLPCYGLPYQACADCYTRKPEPCRFPTPLCPQFCGKCADPPSCSPR